MCIDAHTHTHKSHSQIFSRLQNTSLCLLHLLLPAIALLTLHLWATFTPPRQECSSSRSIRPWPLQSLLLPPQAQDNVSQGLYVLICVPYLLIYEYVNAWWIYTDTMELNINSTEGPKSHLVWKKKSNWWKTSPPDYFVFYNSFFVTFKLSL